MMSPSHQALYKSTTSCISSPTAEHCMSDLFQPQDQATLILYDIHIYKQLVYILFPNPHFHTHPTFRVLEPLNTV
jgi:hypothetical protein